MGWSWGQRLEGASFYCNYYCLKLENTSVLDCQFLGRFIQTLIRDKQTSKT